MGTQSASEGEKSKSKVVRTKSEVKKDQRSELSWSLNSH